MGWRTGQAYSQDLRDRVLAAIDGGMAAGAAAARFQVSLSYIYKAVGRRRQTGEACARRQCSHRRRMLADYHAAIAAEVSARNDQTLAELQAWLLATHGVAASLSGLWNTLRRLELTVKKSRSSPPNKTGRTSRPTGGSGGGSKPNPG